MVCLTNLLTLAAAGALALLNSADAHPGQHHVATAAERSHRMLVAESNRRSLAACANAPHARKLQERALERRAATIAQLRNERAARRLSADDVLAKSHKSNLTGVSVNTPASTLFGTDVKCVLEPTVTQGPYYVNGELIRTDIREKQAGVDLYTELQIIDVNTCEPVADLYVDFWHCNTTGVYAGVVAGGNGDSSDLTNINKTFNRGLAPTDQEGLVTFLTTFPGHYTGRATHIHVLGSHNGTVLPNNTYSGGLASHVGQIFFDQDLISQVEATAAYAANSQPLTTNAQDSIFKESAATGFDPVVEYALLGDAIEEGIFSWISIGIDAKIATTVGAAATWTENGGVANANNGAGGPPGGNGRPPPSGSFNGQRPPVGSGSV
ncbi:hypothetical protein FI667_g13200, partial [Globisporangium splendens]